MSLNSNAGDAEAIVKAVVGFSAAERPAKAACLRPLTDAALLAKALALAQRGVELGKDTELLPSYQLTLGMAEYRNGQYAAAQDSLSTAEQTVGGDNHDIRGIACFFRAMSLFRQGQAEGARRLFSLEQSKMVPFPADESKPLVNGSLPSHDVLIWWMAYKETKSVLGKSVVAKP